MNEIISFFNDIFTGGGQMKVGLSQFKEEVAQSEPVKKRKPAKTETKLSDLMRGA